MISHLTISGLDQPIQRALSYLSLLLLALTLCACSTLSFYNQSIGGQMELLNKRRPITKITADPKVSEQLKAELNLVLEIRDFASAALHLPDNDSYRSYADLGRPYVVWNLIATPEFSLQPEKWCYLIVGCLAYRGYFDKQDAISHADKLKTAGYDVFVGGVSAYSTLGWFDDPVLNTMLRYGPAQLAKVIFHELAHQKIYIKDDTEFNEAFAESVSQIGVRRWLTVQNDPAALLEFEQSLKRESEFMGLVQKYKNRLERLYSNDLPAARMRTDKSSIFKDMADEYRQIRSRWQGHGDYDAWFENGVNNANLAALLTYRDLVPHFMALFTVENGDLKRYYQRIEQLSHCTQIDRRHILQGEMAVTGCLKK